VSDGYLNDAKNFSVALTGKPLRALNRYKFANNN